MGRIERMMASAGYFGTMARADLRDRPARAAGGRLRADHGVLAGDRWGCHLPRSAAMHRVFPADALVGAGDREAAPRDPERSAGRHRPPDRLRGIGLGPRPGHQPGCRGDRAAISGAGVGDGSDLRRDTRRTHPARRLPQFRRAHEGRRRAVARGDARADRSVRHEHRPGAADARRSVADQAAAALRGKGRQARGEAAVSRSCSACSRLSMSLCSGPRSCGS